MNILLTGATGFIGRALMHHLLQQGHFVTAVSRQPNRETRQGSHWIGWDEVPKALNSHAAVIHLAGENVFSGLWTESVKKRVMESRVKSTRMISDALLHDPGTVKVLISASAVGIYGDGGDTVLTEESATGTGFLADVCRAWEAEAFRAQKSVGVSIPRIGVVLEKDGGALAKMIPQFNAFLGGPAGGEQFVPWIHRADLVRALLFAMEKEMSGVWNACAPRAETMSEIANALGRAMNRPVFFKAPASILKIIMGEASSAILASQNLKPERLLQAGFEFKFTDLNVALNAIIRG